MKRICLVAPGHPSKNPRLVKEADALVEEGYSVHVIAGDYHPWGHQADQQYDARSWSIERVSYGTRAPLPRRLYLAGRKRLAEFGAKLFSARIASFNLRAYHWAIPELTSRVRATQADLFIAHYLPALVAVVRGVEEHETRLGFDAEDFHRGEYRDAEQGKIEARLTRWAEENYIHRCDYLTAASPAIAEAYAETVGVDPPATVLNVFPRSERSGHTPTHELNSEHPGEGLSLYWYSQTIGPNRGLEDVIRAMGRLSRDEDDLPRLTLSLRGGWARGYESKLRTLAETAGLKNSQVRHLPRVSPEELVERAAEHDIGLALEQAKSTNRDFCITNKIFVYLQAGLPVVATDTQGQRWVHQHSRESVALCPVGDVEALAEQISQWYRSPKELSCAAMAAEKVADKRFNWDVEKKKFLSCVDDVLHRGSAHE